jgi:enolase
MLNVINGGVHADNSIDLQEFMLVPVGAERFRGAADRRRDVPRAEELLDERGLSTGVGDEGGFAPDLESSEAAIEAILEAAERAGHRDRVAIALDPASSEVFSDGVYRFEGREARAEMAAFWPASSTRSRSSRSRTARRGRLGRLAALTERSATACSSSATTSSSRTRAAARGHRARRRQLDPRQGQPDRHADRDDRGRPARARKRLHAVMSHRSGETEDATIADLAVALARARSRPARPRAATASRSTTSCSASRRSSATGRCIPAGALSRARALVP